MILMAIAIDRLVAFVSGLNRRRLKPFMSKIIVFVAVCVSASISWPMLFFYGTKTFSLGRNLAGKSCHITHQYIGCTAYAVFTIALLTVNILFDVLFIVIYSIIGKKICYDGGFSKNRNRSSSLSGSKIFNRRTSASKTTFMLFIVTMVFVISFVPYCVIVLIRHVTEGNMYIKLNNHVKAVYLLCLRSHALSSAINPVIYSFVNVSFRRKCKMAIYELFYILTCLALKFGR